MISTMSWDNASVASVDIVSVRVRERWTTSVRRAAFQSRSMSGPTGYLACHDCNQAKVDKWPVVGYVDPCTELASERPETYFTFDTKTGEVLPFEDLDQSRFDKAQGMIDDLRLNGRHHLKDRLFWLWMVSRAVPDDSSEETLDTEVDRDRTGISHYPMVEHHTGVVA